MENVRSLDWEPVVGAHALSREGYFAGSDAHRLADLNRAIADPSVSAIWCLRGGYGVMRLLDRVDYETLHRRPKSVIGYSDITALHSAIGSRCDLVTFHGPTARTPLTDFSRRSLQRAVAHGEDPCGEAVESRVLRPGRGRGRLAGGNLALLASLAGTPFARGFAGAILVLEDVNEPVYRLDRMLQQLRLSGLLERCSGIVAGQFTACAEESDDGARCLDDVLLEIADEFRIPCLAGAPIGHVHDQWTIPLGTQAELDTDERTVRVPALFAM